jgi:hypothetical protein
MPSQLLTDARRWVRFVQFDPAGHLPNGKDENGERRMRMFSFAEHVLVAETPRRRNRFDRRMQTVPLGNL